MTLINPGEVVSTSHTCEYGNASRMVFPFSTTGRAAIRDGDTFKIGTLCGGSRLTDMQYIHDPLGEGVTLDIGYHAASGDDADAFFAVIDVSQEGSAAPVMWSVNHDEAVDVTLTFHCADLVTNGGFASDISGWTATGWTWGSGKVAHGSGNTSALSQDVGAVAGDTYQVSYALTITTGSVTPSLGSTNGTTRTASGTYFEDIECGEADGVLRFTPTSTSDAAIDDVVVRAVPDGGVEVQSGFLFTYR